MTNEIKDDNPKLDVIILEPTPRDQMRLDYFTRNRDDEGMSFPSWRLTHQHGVIVSLSNNKIVGVLGYVLPNGLSHPDDLKIEHIYIMPGMRHQGRGKSMVEAVSLLAQVRSMKRITAAAQYEDHSLQEFLVACGFIKRLVTSIPAFYSHYYLPIGV